MKILIADDHPIFRKGLADIIKDGFPHAEIEEAENGVVAEKSIRNNIPAVAILDIEMPEKDGIQVCKEIKALILPVKLIILTMYKSSEVFTLALNAGIDGFILKDNSAEEIIACIHSVMDEKQYISHKMQEYLNENAIVKKQHLEINSGIVSLTKREKKVLQMVADNLSSKEIALRLFVTPKSVENYRSRICKKLGLERENNSLIKWALHNNELLKLISI